MAEYDETEPVEPTEPPKPDKRMAKWRARIECARKLRRDWEREYRVEDCEKFYLGKQQKGLPPGVKVINHFLSTINVTLPGLLFDNPSFLARPKTGVASPGSREQAKLAEGILSNIASQGEGLYAAARLGLLQNFFRIAVLKCIYDPSLVPNPRAGRPIYETDAAGNAQHDPATGEPVSMLDPTTGEPMVEPDQVMDGEVYRWEWVDARRILLPEDGPDQSKWSWIGEEIEVPLEEAKADERFPSDLRNSFRDSGRSYDDVGGQGGGEGVDSSRNEDDGYEPCFRYTECYDLKEKRWYILADDEQIKEFLLDQPLPDGVKDHPYAIMQGWFPILGPDPSPWPLPFTNPWLDLQQEYNIRRLQMMEGAKRSARKVLYETNTFEDADEALKLLQSNRDMEGVMVRDVGRPPVPFQEVNINGAITQDIPALLADWRMVTGQTGMKMGVATADTATEATFVERASNLRDAELQKAVVRWLRTAGRKMWQLVRSTLTLKLFVTLRAMDDVAIALYMESTYGVPQQALAMFPQLADGLVQKFGQETIEPVTREDLAFDADIDVIPASTKPRNLTVERQQWLEFITLVANAPQLALSRTLLEETAAKYDFISPQMVEEIHALAMTMIQVRSAQAGRGGGGEQGQVPGESAKNGKASQASQGTEQA